LKKDYLVKIAAIRTGYVGLVSGACLADFGNTVVCVDTDGKKIQKLRDGGIPIFEPGLDEVVKRTVPIGTARKVQGWVSEELARRGVEHGFDVVSNPEFLREGTAVYDFQGGARCGTVRCAADSTRQPRSQTRCVCGARCCAVGAQRPRSSPKRVIGNGV